LAPATGRELGRIELPAEETGAWSNLRVWQDYLVGQSGKRVLCRRRAGGQWLWKHECGRERLSLAVGGEKVFCAEVPERRRGETSKDGAVCALNIKTGELLWRIPGGSEVRYSQPLDLVVTSSGIFQGKDGRLLAALPEVSPADAKKPAESLPRPLFVIGKKLLHGAAEQFVTYDLLAGKPTGDSMAWIRRGCTIPRASSNLVTTRFRGNAACIDLASHHIICFWNVRAACSNNLFPANGLLNMPSLTGGCTCNYLPVSQAFAPSACFERVAWRRVHSQMVSRRDVCNGFRVHGLGQME
jgi:hypothetical protein